MKKTSIKSILISISILMYGLTSCYLEESRTSVELPYEILSINPATIVEDISQGKKNIFIPVVEKMPLNEIEYILVQWDQEDYISIANAIHEFIWSEDLTHWKLNSIFFYLQCSEVAAGPQSAYFTYFKILEESTEKYRLVHEIVVQPQEKAIVVSAKRHSHLITTWEEYDMSEFRINSSDALNIAEKNGGKLFRGNNNDCSVSISLNRAVDNNKDWVVFYDNYLEIMIDPITGAYRVKK